MEIKLEYKRLRELDGGEYPYTGQFALRGESFSFIGLHFKNIIGRLSEMLNESPGVDQVILQRTDREGISPVLLGSRMIDLIRVDPLSALREMTFDTSQFSNSADVHSRRAETFSSQIYLPMASGTVLCPILGEWLNMAYKAETGEWFIRPPGNDSSAWLKLDQVLDNSPSGTPGIERLVFCRWAVVSLDALLGTDAEYFMLPRRWNKTSSYPHISRGDLESLRETYKENYE